MFEWVRSTLLRIFGQQSTDLVVSPTMQSLIQRWAELYEGPGCDPLRLPAGIASEFARLVVLESEIKLSGVRGEWLDEQLIPFRRSLRANVEYACALGGVVFKPYVVDNGLAVDVVQADAFFPTSFDTSGRLVGAVFVEQIIRGGRIYTRLESHEFAAGHETIENKAFCSSTASTLGGEVALGEVEEWADITPSIKINDIDRPTFAYFRIPLANNRDRRSPLGVSVFANAVDTIAQAGEQYGRLLWEYEGGQMAIDVDESAVRKSEDGSVKLDQREQRLYRRSLNLIGSNGQSLYSAFAPALRDGSYLAGLDDILKKIEWQCSLSYGTLSNPASIAKTATEVRASKQRSYAAVSDIQAALQSACDDLLHAMDVLAKMYGLGPAGDYEVSYQWHDSVLTDEETARQMDRDDALNGFVPKWRYNMDWRGMSEDEARAAVAEAAGEVPDPYGFDMGGGT